MFRFITEKKDRPSLDQNDCSLMTPMKTVAKQLFASDKENNPKENGNSLNCMTPFTKRIKMNIEKAHLISNDIIARISELEQQLEHTRNKLEEEHLNLEQVFDTPSCKDKREIGLKFEFSDLKLESAQKVHRQSFYFSGIQKLKGLAKRYLGFDHFNNYQLKAFQKILIGSQVFLNGTFNSGKMTTYLLYAKLMIEEKLDVSSKREVVIVSSLKRVPKLEQALKILNLCSSVKVIRCTEMESYFEERPESTDPALLVFDCLSLNLENVLRIKKMIRHLKDEAKVFITGFYHTDEIALALDFLKIPKGCAVVSHGLANLKDKTQYPRISVSYDESMGKSVMKFIRDCIDTERSKKLKIRRENHIDFAIFTKDKSVREFITEFAGQHAFKVCTANRLAADSDIALVYSLTEITFSFKHLFILDFEFDLEQFCFVNANFNKNVHICLNAKIYELKRKEYLGQLASPAIFLKVISCLQENERLSVLSLDHSEKPIEAQATEGFLKFLHLKGMAEIIELTVYKKISITIKNSQAIRDRAHEYSNLLPIIDLWTAKGEVQAVVEPEVFLMYEANLQSLKREGLISFNAAPLRKISFSSKYRKIASMKSQFRQIILEYNDKVLMNLKRIDCFYSLLKSRGYAHITRTKNTEKTDFQILQPELEKIFFAANLPIEDDNGFPFKINYKKHDLIRDFCTIIKDNLALVNEIYFGRLIIDEFCTYDALIIDIIHQVYSDSKYGFAIDALILQKLRSMNVVRVVEQLRNTYETVKKELLN